MSTNVRFIVAIFCAAVLGALSTPELSSKLPPGTATIIAMAIASALHRMDPKGPSDPPAPPAQVTP